MNRRDFFRLAAIIAAGIVAADQLELLERLGHSRIFALGGMPGAAPPMPTAETLNALWRKIQGPLSEFAVNPRAFGDRQFFDNLPKLRSQSLYEPPAPWRKWENTFSLDGLPLVQE